MRGWLCLLSAGISVGIAAPQALGASVRVVTSGGAVVDRVYRAAPGELNNLRASALVSSGGTAESPAVSAAFTFQEAAVPILPGARCARIGGPRGVRCANVAEATVVAGATIDLADRSDVARVSGKPFTFAGGRPIVPGFEVYGRVGNDRLIVGTDATGSLYGGAGNDALAGGAWADRLVGGPGRDRISGGGGTDIVSYADHILPVTVDLRRISPQGSRGEGDSITGVEGVIGGRGPDVLIGNSGRNVLQGKGGNDRLSSADGQAERIDCGPGSDTATVDRLDIAVGCERVRVAG